MIRRVPFLNFYKIKIMAQVIDGALPNDRPFVGVWSRLEGRPRKVNFDRALRAEVHDALWMLTRQWQFGEFKGEDTGSAVFAKTQIKKSPLARTAYGDLNAPGLQAEGYQSEVPLEAKVESEAIPFDLKMHQQVTMYWRKLLKSKGLPKSIYLNFLFNYLLNDAPPSSLVTANITTAEAGKVNEAAAELITWMEQLYVEPASGQNAWIPARLEYQFGNSARTDTNTKTALVAKEYHSGKLDWYAYDLEEALSSSHPLRNSTAIPDEATTVETVPLTLIPTEVRFGGMPVSRWWEFEDGHVDFGDLNASTTDVPKIMMAEFALLYSNDWQIIPFTLPVGHLCKVNTIVVTDVFGQKTNIQAANLGEDENWQRWSLFNLSKQNEGSAAQADNQLLLPTTRSDFALWADSDRTSRALFHP